MKKFLPTVLMFVLFCTLSLAIFIGVRKQSQAFHFEDETDHVAVGWMMHRFDKKLYADLSTNHQPLPVLAGAVLAKVVPYVTLFDLIERLRISMFVYGALWGLVIASRFKWKGIFSYAFTYSVGYYFFAWHVLAESFAAPALLFVFLLLFEKMFQLQKQPKMFALIDGTLAGIAFACMVTTLLPLWPFCVLAGLGLVYFGSKTERAYLIGSALLFIGVVFLFFSPIDWYRETVTNNLLYQIPYSHKPSSLEWVNLAFFPFLSLLKPFDQLAQTSLFPLLISLGLVVFAFFKQKKISPKTILTGLYIYVLLIITNPRVLTFPIAFYQGFHLFPFIAGFFALTISVSWLVLSKQWPKKAPGIATLLFLPLLFFNLQWARRNTDKLNEYYVQYGTQDSYARLLSVFKKEGDTFFSGPNGFGYINMRSDVPIAGRQLFHLQWAYLSPQLKAEFDQLMAENPPMYIYLLEDESGYHRDLQPILKEKYTEVIQGKGRTFLYFHNTKVMEATEEQKKYLVEKDLHFRTAAEGELF